MQAQTLDDQLRFAIANARLIEVTYHAVRRVAEPHDYGIQNGKPRLLVYQQSAGGAGTRDQSVKGWRLLEVAKITDCVVLETTFPGSRGAAHRRHYSWDIVYARVD